MAQKQYRVSDEQVQEIAAAAGAEQIVKRLITLAREPRSDYVTRERDQAWGQLRMLSASRLPSTASNAVETCPAETPAPEVRPRTRKPKAPTEEPRTLSAPANGATPDHVPAP